MAKKSDIPTPASAWPPVMREFSNPVAGLAAMLAREGQGFYRAPAEVVRDAETIIDAAVRLCEPSRNKQSVGAYLARVAAAAKPYGAEVVTGDELSEGVLGLRLCKPRYGRPGALFVVA